MNTHLLLLIGGLGAMEVALILAVVLLMFGGKKIPELMRGLGKGVREFNDARSSLTKEFREGMNETTKEGSKEEASKIAVPSREEIQK